MEGLGDAGVEPEGPIDLARLQEFLLEADVVARMRDLPRLLAAQLDSRSFLRSGGQMSGLSRSDREARLLNRHLERLHILRPEPGRVRIGNVAADRRLADGEPRVVSRNDIEELHAKPRQRAQSQLELLFRRAILSQACE
jgi:hypothetical protein